MSKRLTQTISTLARLLIGVGIIYWIFRRINLPDLREVLSGCLSQWPWIIAGIGLAGLVLLLGAIRWRIILRARNLDLSWSRILRIYLIGQFFNSFMLGMAGGDLVRAFYTTRAVDCCKTEALATVLVDRVSGMFMVYLLALMMMAINAEMFISHWVLHLPALLMLVMIACGVALILLVFNAHRFKTWLIFGFVRRRPAVERVLRNLWDVFYLFRRRPLIVLQTSVISLLAQLVMVGQWYCLGRSLQIPLLFVDYLAIVPLIMSLSAVPITPGGLGVREALSVTMLRAFGVAGTRSLPLSLMIYGMALFWSIVGGLVFIVYSSGAGHAIGLEVAELREEIERESVKLGIPGTKD